MESRGISVLFLVLLGLTGTMAANMCDTNPCNHGGHCISALNGYLCTCQPHYKGVNCEIEYPGPCLNETYGLECPVCENAPNETACALGGTQVCYQQHLPMCYTEVVHTDSGDYITKGCREFDYCLGYPNAFETVDSVNNINTTETCSYEINDCSEVDYCGQGICVNGNCTNTPTAPGYHCDCPDNKAGWRCEYSIDEPDLDVIGHIFEEHWKFQGCDATVALIYPNASALPNCTFSVYIQQNSTSAEECAEALCTEAHYSINVIAFSEFFCMGFKCDYPIDDWFPCENGTVDIYNVTFGRKPYPGPCADEGHGPTCMVCVGENEADCDANAVEVVCYKDQPMCLEIETKNICLVSPTGYNVTHFVRRCGEFELECPIYPDPVVHGVTSITSYQCYFNESTCDDINECDHGVCQRGGICNNLDPGYSCVCPPTSTGVNCETDIDECETVTCANGGQCVNEDPGYHCECMGGYTGDLCDETDYCYGIWCSHNGTCENVYDEINNNGTFYCNCVPPWHGIICSNSSAVHCDPNPCEHGTCWETLYSYQCQCDDPWVGLICDKQYPGDCAEGFAPVCVKCNNAASEGACDELVTEQCTYELPMCSTVIVEEFDSGNNLIETTVSMGCMSIIQCPEIDPDVYSTEYTLVNGNKLVTSLKCYFNDTCEDIDECVNPMICNNHPCINTDGGYTCNCTGIWNGTNCETYDFCLADPCENEATCTSTNVTFTCHCNEFYYGEYCEIDINECDLYPSLCVYGTCVNADPGYTCTCFTYATGERCETDLSDTCNGITCQNGATCIDLGDSYYCRCTQSWTGTECDEDIDECVDPNICRHGECVNTAGSYYCRCDPDDSQDDTCGENGQCMDDGTGQSYCECDENYYGRYCEWNQRCKCEVRGDPLVNSYDGEFMELKDNCSDVSGDHSFWLTNSDTNPQCRYEATLQVDIGCYSMNMTAMHVRINDTFLTSTVYDFTLDDTGIDLNGNDLDVNTASYPGFSFAQIQHTVHGDTVQEYRINYDPFVYTDICNIEISYQGNVDPIQRFAYISVSQPVAPISDDISLVGLCGNCDGKENFYGEYSLEDLTAMTMVQITPF